MGDSWQNRIVGTGMKPANEFLANPNNWRVHPKSQQDSLKGVLSEVGWVQNVIENIRTGNLIDGHLRIAEALKQGDDTPVPYIQVDLSEEEEVLVLATLDPLAALATADKDKLDELLREISTNDANVQQMLSKLAADSGLYKFDPSAEWQGMPEFEQEDQMGIQSIHVHFMTREDVEDFGELVGQKITEKTRSIWYPQAERIDMSSEVYRDEP